MKARKIIKYLIVALLVIGSWYAPTRDLMTTGLQKGATWLADRRTQRMEKKLNKAFDYIKENPITP